MARGRLATWVAAVVAVGMSTAGAQAVAAPAANQGQAIDAATTPISPSKPSTPASPPGSPATPAGPPTASPSEPEAPVAPPSPPSQASAEPKQEPVSDRLTALAERLAARDGGSTGDVAETRPAAAADGGAPALPENVPREAGRVRTGRESQPLLSDPKERLPLGRATASGAAGAPVGKPAASSASASWVLSTLGALGLVLVAVFVLRAVLTRWLGGAVAAGHTGVLEVLTRVAIAPRNHVLLLRLGPRILVVSDSAAGVRTLAQIDDPEEVAALLTTVAASQPNSVSKTFGHLFERFSRDHRAPHLNEEGGDDSEFQLDRTRDHVSGLLSRIRALTGRTG